MISPRLNFTPPYQDGLSGSRNAWVPAVMKRSIASGREEAPAPAFLALFFATFLAPFLAAGLLATGMGRRDFGSLGFRAGFSAHVERLVEHAAASAAVVRDRP